jgi:hypothetical protein
VLGFDEKIAALASGKPAAALAVGALLGLRHPLDPDHVAAVGAIARGARDRAGRVGLAWGAGHASTVLALGVPVVVWRAALPEGPQRALEALIGVLVLALGLRLLLRGDGRRARVDRRAAPRSVRAAFVVGMTHGAAGSAGIGLLLLAAVPDRVVAVAALVVFATAATVAMTTLAAGLGRAVGRIPTRPVALLACGFGLWYMTAAALGAGYSL